VLDLESIMKPAMDNFAFPSLFLFQKIQRMLCFQKGDRGCGDHDDRRTVLGQVLDFWRIRKPRRPLGYDLLERDFWVDMKERDSWVDMRERDSWMGMKEMVVVVAFYVAF